MDFLIDQIRSQQFRMANSGFGKGQFYAFRNYPYLRLKRIDNNIFFTALVLRHLQSFLKVCSSQQALVIQEMIDLALPNFSRYAKQEQGTTIYQFWPIGPNNHFPNGYFLHRFRKFKSPPDSDDTALAYLVLSPPVSEVEKWRNYLIRFSNGYDGKWNRKIPNHRKWEGVYSTWMGTGAMPIEFDVVVMMNILSVFLKAGLVLNDYDRKTLNYIETILTSGHYLQAPFYAAPWYPNPVLIFYHVVKFFKECLPEKMEEHTTVLRRQFQQLRASIQHGGMEELLLVLSASYLGVDRSQDTMAGFTPKDESTFHYYIGGMLTATRSQAGWRLAKHPVFHWRFICPALNYALQLECMEVIKANN